MALLLQKIADVIRFKIALCSGYHLDEFAKLRPLLAKNSICHGTTVINYIFNENRHKLF